MEKNHVDNLSDEDKKKWLKQRGWLSNGTTGTFFRDPDTGLNYGFNTAVENAKKGCRLPYDFLLHP